MDLYLISDAAFFVVGLLVGMIMTGSYYKGKMEVLKDYMNRMERTDAKKT